KSIFITFMSRAPLPASPDASGINPPFAKHCIHKTQSCATRLAKAQLGNTRREPARSFGIPDVSNPTSS
ncbi:MAG: hypothetical protein IJ131_06615, partial [Eggerthellaceae bacterium]|nr:hypothetical protein [Eggerthellaceae bacterium]